MQTVSSTYLDALRDEREILRQAIADGEDLATLSRDMLANVEATIARGWSGPMLDYMRAGRDFWRHQVKKYPA
jgi:hypothetical protein